MEGHELEEETYTALFSTITGEIQTNKYKTRYTSIQKVETPGHLEQVQPGRGQPGQQALQVGRPGGVIRSSTVKLQDVVPTNI